jgi:hypothetical protein
MQPVLKLGELVEIVSGPYIGETGIIQDVLGRRTYVISNNVVVDYYQINIIRSSHPRFRMKDLLSEVVDGKWDNCDLTDLKTRAKKIMESC